MVVQPTAEERRARMSFNIPMSRAPPRMIKTSSVARVPTFKQGMQNIRQFIRHPIRAFRSESGQQFLYGSPDTREGTKLISNLVVGSVVPETRAAGAISTTFKGLGKIAKFLTPSFNPRVVIPRALATAGVETAFTGARVLGGGKLPTDKEVAKMGIYSGISGIFPPAALAGYLYGKGKQKTLQGAQTLGQVYQNVKGNFTPVPMTPMSSPKSTPFFEDILYKPPTFNVNLPSQNFEFPSSLVGSTPVLPTGELPSASMGGSFAPSVQVGGGGFDPSMLLLLAGGAGLLGYGLGKRGRKKKRAKRKKYKRGKRK